MRSFLKPFFLLILLSGLQTFAQQTQVRYLSGAGSDDAVEWKFMVNEGRKAGEWSSLPVPSNWEQFGFGTYNYGLAKNEERGKEVGFYKYEFSVPAEWQKKQVEIVFEGSMTDTQVKINGKLTGPVHQGAFYRFKYDISNLLEYGNSEENLLEVRVAKQSENTSVNKAERHADFWIFGGIFRPVYLQAKPKENIERVAINAEANGDFQTKVFLDGLKERASVEAQLMNLDGEPIGNSFSAKVPESDDSVTLQSHFKGIKAWNPEDPNLYRVRLQLVINGKVVHQTTQRFGFRTVELREHDGIYVNGTKIKFKGVNRHTFWPTTGRASSKKRSIEDVLLMKNMNMNAVRMSHYPPDQHFLEVADSLGLFVLDELAGWHNAYDTKVGKKLVKEMVIRDVNHPSILFWDNGNEGGHNTDLDSLFQKYDIQNRRTIHPWQSFNGMSNQHYRPYNYGVGTFWNGHEVVFPTEFLHGMYDGGAGAGLNDFWKMIWDKPRAAGGFLWVFADEGLKRTDSGEIDTYHGSAADGILGPFHEKEGSYFAIKEIWAPVHFQNIDITKDFEGSLQIENQYFYTNLKQVEFSWKLKKLPLANEDRKAETVEGKAPSPDIAPARIGELNLSLPKNWQQYDILYVTATDKFGREIYTWSWPLEFPKDVVDDLISQNTAGAVKMQEEENKFIVHAGGIEFQIGKKDGLLKKVINSKGEIPFNKGPHLSAGKVEFKSLEVQKNADTLSIVSSFDKESRLKQFTWSFYPSGWAKLEIYYKPEEYDVDFDYMGVDFSYPEELVKGVKWFGRGPYRVWKNRMQGVEYDVYQKDYNNTITGVSPLVYPEFKGYHANLYWAKIQSKEQSFLVATSTNDVFLRLFTPEYPQDVYEVRTSPAFPDQDISFMQAIPAIGSKTNQPERLGPSGQKNIFFDYGTFDDWRTRSKTMTLFFNFSAGQ